MNVFTQRGLMVGDAAQCPPGRLLPLMPRAQLTRVEHKIWEGGPENPLLPLSDLAAFRRQGVATVAWSVHHVGENHQDAARQIAARIAAQGFQGLNLNLEAGWFVDRNQVLDYPPIFQEMAGLLAAIDAALGSSFPLAVTIIPAKVYPFAMFMARGVDVFVEEYDGDCDPLPWLDYQLALTFELTDAAEIPRERVHRCVSKVQLPAAGPILVFAANVMDDGDYR